MTSRWHTYAVPLDGDPWTAVTDHRLVTFTRGEAPGRAPTRMMLAEELQTALTVGTLADRDRLCDFATDGYCLGCHCEREVRPRRVVNGPDALVPCVCVDDVIRASFFGAIFDLRLVATALVRLPPGDIFVGAFEPSRLVLRSESDVAVLLGIRVNPNDPAPTRVWGST